MSDARADLDPIRFPQRKSIRLKDYDYSSGLYFVTICVAGRRPLLSRIRGGRTSLTPIGNIVQDEWLGTNQIRGNAWVDAFVIMPDHFHGIVAMASDTDIGLDVGFRAHAVRPCCGGTLGTLIAGFKSACTRRYRALIGDYAGALWQRGYYERFIRDTRQLRAIRRYIAENPRCYLSHSRKRS
jgi:REP element-mobilizing transposase RayT